MNYYKKEDIVLEKCIAGGVLYKNIYRGNWKNNKPNGFGIQYKYPDVYIGNFKNGKRDGYGILKCKEGYKMTRKYKCKYMFAGTYFGIFKNNVFQKGKVIEFNREKNEKSVYFMNKSKINGEYRIFHKNYTFLFHYFNGQLFGEYKYYGDYIVNSNLFDGELHGNSTIITKDGCRHYVFYSFGNIEGKSIYYLPNGTYFILQWENNICLKIKCIRNRHNKLYYPEKIIENLNVKIPLDFLCPIGYTIMIQPYINDFKQTYEFKNLKLWIKEGKINREYIRDPMTNKLCSIDSFKPNINVQYNIFKFMEETLFPSKIFYIK